MVHLISLPAFAVNYVCGSDGWYHVDFGGGNISGPLTQRCSITTRIAPNSTPAPTPPPAAK